MAAVSNCSPLRYLIAIHRADLLHTIFEDVIIPAAVERELTHSSSPDEIRRWMSNRPAWLTVHELRTPVEASLTEVLDAGESQAIQLALTLKSDFLLIDERQGRREAELRGARTIGALGVLLEAHRRGLVPDPMQELNELRGYGFRVSKRLVDEFRSLAK